VPSPAASLDGLPFPTEQGVVVPPGRYASRPPFAVPFTFEVVGADWRTWHHLVEFIDIAKYDSSAQFFLPSRWLAFAHPEAIFGPGEDPASDLDPTGAVALWASRDDLVVGTPEPFELDGLPGVRVDVHAPAPNTHIFGGARGDLGMQPEIDARIGIVALEDGLLLVLALAPPAELEAAWTEVAPILASVSLAGG
jgi:hypothetical protein